MIKENLQVKCCGHTCTPSGLKFCCACSDQRPKKEEGLYPTYVDGHGWQDIGHRNDGYCPPCKLSTSVTLSTTSSKLCGHQCTPSSLKYCCACMDMRPMREENTYPEYIDGAGWSNTGSRSAGYCPLCKHEPSKVFVPHNVQKALPVPNASKVWKASNASKVVLNYVKKAPKPKAPTTFSSIKQAALRQTHAPLESLLPDPLKLELFLDLFDNHELKVNNVIKELKDSTHLNALCADFDGSPLPSPSWNLDVNMLLTSRYCTNETPSLIARVYEHVVRTTRARARGDSGGGEGGGDNSEGGCKAASSCEEGEDGDDDEGCFLCGPMAGLASEHYYAKEAADEARTSKSVRVLMKELTRVLPQGLAVDARGGSMFVRFDEDQPQFIRAVLTGVEGTPYASGVFVFDIYCPPDYPNVPCQVTHVTPQANQIKARHSPGGFSPNLHSDSGKVCLSLLGTWSGLGWEPNKSNIYQVLSSIQLMILGANHPYYMEPGHGGWEGNAPDYDTDPNKTAVLTYEEDVRFHTALLCVLAPLKAPPKGFEGAVSAHFCAKRHTVVDTLEAWVRQGTPSLATRLRPVVDEIRMTMSAKLPLMDLEEDVSQHLRALWAVRRKVLLLSHARDEIGPFVSRTHDVQKAQLLAEMIEQGEKLVGLERQALELAQRDLHAALGARGVCCDGEEGLKIHDAVEKLLSPVAYVTTVPSVSESVLGWSAISKTVRMKLLEITTPTDTIGSGPVDELAVMTGGDFDVKDKSSSGTKHGREGESPRSATVEQPYSVTNDPGMPYEESKAASLSTSSNNNSDILSVAAPAVPAPAPACTSPPSSAFGSSSRSDEFSRAVTSLPCPVDLHDVIADCSDSPALLPPLLECTVDGDDGVATLPLTSKCAGGLIAVLANQDQQIDRHAEVCSSGVDTTAAVPWWDPLTSPAISECVIIEGAVGPNSRFVNGRFKLANEFVDGKQAYLKESNDKVGLRYWSATKQWLVQDERHKGTSMAFAYIVLPVDVDVHIGAWADFTKALPVQLVEEGALRVGNVLCPIEGIAKGTDGVEKGSHAHDHLKKPTTASERNLGDKAKLRKRSKSQSDSHKISPTKCSAGALGSKKGVWMMFDGRHWRAQEAVTILRCHNMFSDKGMREANELAADEARSSSLQDRSVAMMLTMGHDIGDRGSAHECGSLDVPVDPKDPKARKEGGLVPATTAEGREGCGLPVFDPVDASGATESYADLALLEIFYALHPPQQLPPDMCSGTDCCDEVIEAIHAIRTARSQGWIDAEVEVELREDLVEGGDVAATMTALGREVAEASVKCSPVWDDLDLEPSSPPPLSSSSSFLSSLLSFSSYSSPSSLSLSSSSSSSSWVNVSTISHSLTGAHVERCALVGGQDAEYAECLRVDAEAQIERLGREQEEEQAAAALRQARSHAWRVLQGRHRCGHQGQGQVAMTSLTMSGPAPVSSRVRVRVQFSGFSAHHRCEPLELMMGSDDSVDNLLDAVLIALLKPLMEAKEVASEPQLLYGNQNQEHGHGESKEGTLTEGGAVVATATAGNNWSKGAHEADDHEVSPCVLASCLGIRVGVFSLFPRHLLVQLGTPFSRDLDKNGFGACLDDWSLARGGNIVVEVLD